MGNLESECSLDDHLYDTSIMDNHIMSYINFNILQTFKGLNGLTKNQPICFWKPIKQQFAQL